jgi:uncharacterized protein DUF5995
MTMQANTIDEAISIMDDIVHDCILNSSRLGFFAALYRTTTLVVKEHCDRGDFFEDSERLRKLDVIFANRYFEAYEAYQKQVNLSESWRVSFERAKRENLLILQHLLLGMNAHIGLDLGIAVAEIANGDMDEVLQRDFFRLNNLLAGMIDMIQEEIGSVSPLLKYMDWLVWRTDETFVSFSMNIARDRAMQFAQELIALPKDQWSDAIKQRDNRVANFNRIIGSTRWYLLPAIWFVCLAESSDPRKITEILSDETRQQVIQTQIKDRVKQAEAQGLDLAKPETNFMKTRK